MLLTIETTGDVVMVVTRGRGESEEFNNIGLEGVSCSHWEVWTGHPSPLGVVLMKHGHEKALS